MDTSWSGLGQQMIRAVSRSFEAQVSRVIVSSCLLKLLDCFQTKLTNFKVHLYFKADIYSVRG